MTQYLKCCCNTKNVQWPLKRTLAAENTRCRSLVAVKTVKKMYLVQIPNNILGAISYTGNFKTPYRNTN